MNKRGRIRGNSSLELHSADLANFGRSQTISLVSRPKFAKNHESQTKNPSVVLNAESMVSSLRGRIVDSHEAIHKSKMDCHDFANANSRNDGLFLINSTNFIAKGYTL